MDKYVVDCNAIGTEIEPTFSRLDAQGKPVYHAGVRTFRTTSQKVVPMSLSEEAAHAAEGAAAAAAKVAAVTKANEQAELRTLKERLLDNMLRGQPASPADASRYAVLSNKYPV